MDRKSKFKNRELLNRNPGAIETNMDRCALLNYSITLCS